jgi:penicillin amidase
LKWTALDPKNADLEAFYYLNRAKDWTGFQDALRLYGGATQNFVYADVRGNIGWYAAGRIPIRKTGDGAFPYDGTTHEGDWVGMIPFEELPNLYNPVDGFIVTANQRIVGTDYKYQQISRDAAAPWRARRLYDILKTDNKATMDSAGAAQHDSLNLPLHMLARDLVSSGALTAQNTVVVRSWDGRMMPDSRAALLVNEIRNCASNKMAEDNKPAPASVIRERVLHWAVRENAVRWLPKGHENFASLFKTCESEAVALFSQRYGTDATKWVWGAAWTARFNHPLAAAPLIGMQFAVPRVPIDGSGQTPNVGSAVSMRHITSPGNWDATRHVIPLGQSGDPKSPHFKDQFEAWRTGTPAIFPFTKSAVESAARSVQIFAPLKN